MKTNSISFPSVIEATFGDSENTASSLLTGTKIKYENLWFNIGELAKNEGTNPQKVINCAPDERDFELIFKAALLNLANHVQQPITLTLGLPFSTYNSYKPLLNKLLEKKFFTIDYSTEPYILNGTAKRTNIEIEKFDIIPELVADVIGIKKIFTHKKPKNFIVLSLGYGTCEGGMVTNEGLLQRTCFSTFGIKYVVTNLYKELNKTHYLNMKNECFLNDSLVNGYLIANRKRIDLKQLRKDLLTQYYLQVISPAIRSNIGDRDFEKCECIYLVGGGAYFEDLTNSFINEFNDFIKIEILSDSQNIASLGYLYNSQNLTNSDKQCAGIDLGNSTTIISYFDV
jgi:hypothetical protein